MMILKRDHEVRHVKFRFVNIRSLEDRCTVRSLKLKPRCRRANRTKKE